MRTLTITEKFATWKVEYLNNKLKEKRTSSTQTKYLTELSFWKKVLSELCVHNFQSSNDNEETKNCTKCGLNEHSYEMTIGEPSAFEQGCHNCEFLETEGGDFVDYGSTTISTPEYSFCMNVAFEEEEKEEEMYKTMRNSHECLFWEGKQNT